MTTRVLLLACCLFFIVACDTEHRGHNITEFYGDFRFDGDIGEFFDCVKRKKYFLARSGAYGKLKEEYGQLGMKNKDDVYIHVEGYVKQEDLMEGLDPVTVFVVVRLLGIEQERGCSRSARLGG